MKNLKKYEELKKKIFDKIKKRLYKKLFQINTNTIYISVYNI